MLTRQLARIVIGATVFALGLLVSAGLAAWFEPPVPLDGDEHCPILRTVLKSANSMSSRQPHVCPASMSKSSTASHQAVTAEQTSINLQAAPLFDAFGHFVENANAFAF
jgi:hypothetical protein